MSVVYALDQVSGFVHANHAGLCTFQHDQMMLVDVGAAYQINNYDGASAGEAVIHVIHMTLYQFN